MSALEVGAAVDTAKQRANPRECTASAFPRDLFAEALHDQVRNTGIKARRLAGIMTLLEENKASRCRCPAAIEVQR
jgi:hypothetical protein